MLHILKNLPFEPFFDTKIQVKSKTKVVSWFHAHLEIELYISSIQERANKLFPRI